jgi:diguanylate cyclase
MDQTHRFTAAAPAGEAHAAGTGHPMLALLDEIRGLLAPLGLPPVPDTYELFWLFVTRADAGLARAMETELAAGGPSADAVSRLRRAHLGDIAGAELMALVGDAREQASQFAGRLARGAAALGTYDEAVAREDAVLAGPLPADALAALVQRLRRANATMMAANRRVAADLDSARLETARLLDRLEAAERVARTDPLTGLLNRRGILAVLDTALPKAAATGEPLSVGLVDIDHFQRINDQWGHAIGDEALRCVAAHVQASARRAGGDRAVAGRYGGEEFLVILPGLGLPAAAGALDECRGALARQILRRASDGVSLGRVTFSGGIALAREGDSSATIVDRADAALFAAQRAGHDRVLPEAPHRP